MTAAAQPNVQIVNHRVRLPRNYGWQQRAKQLIWNSPARFIVLVMGRRAGKTHFCSENAGKAAMRYRREVPWIAPTQDISDRGRGIFEDLWSPAFDPDVNSGQTVLGPPAKASLLGGGFVKWFTTHGKYTKKAGGKGAGVLGGGFPLVILDEGARIPWGLVEQEIVPTVADTGGKIVVPTTPRGARNWIFNWYQKAKAGNPLYGYVQGPSTESRNPHTHQFVEMMRGEMDPQLFRQEILAEFLEGEGTVFRKILDLVRGDYLPGPQLGSSYVIGCDVAKHQDWTVMDVMDVETGHTVHMERFNQLSWPIIEDRIAHESKRWNDAVIWLDSTGVGDPIYDYLEARGVPVEGTKFTNESKAHLVQALAAAIDKQEISYPEDDLVTGELEVFDYEMLPSGKFRYGAPEGFHDDIVIAKALAVFGRNNRLTGVVV